MKTFTTVCFLTLQWLVPPLRCSEAQEHSPHRSRRETDILVFQEDWEHKSSSEVCQDMANHQHRHLSSRSLSPWKYKICTDPNRYPSIIRKAECLQEHCHIKGNKMHVHLISVPLTYSMEVMYKRGDHVTLETLEIPIGCTCIYPRYST